MTVTAAYIHASSQEVGNLEQRDTVGNMSWISAQLRISWDCELTSTSGSSTCTSAQGHKSKAADSPQ